MSVNKWPFCTYLLTSLSFSVTNKFRNKCWSWEKKTNHILIWIFIINVMKGVSLSTYLKVVFYMKSWIPPMSCSFQLTQHCCTLTHRTNVYCDWFRDSGIRTNFMNFTSQNAKIALQNQKTFLPVAGYYKPCLAQEFLVKLLCDDNSNAGSKCA